MVWVPGAVRVFFAPLPIEYHISHARDTNEGEKRRAVSRGLCAILVILVRVAGRVHRVAQPIVLVRSPRPDEDRVRMLLRLFKESRVFVLLLWPVVPESDHLRLAHIKRRCV